MCIRDSNVTDDRGETRVVGHHKKIGLISDSSGIPLHPVQPDTSPRQVFPPSGATHAVP